MIHCTLELFGAVSCSDRPSHGSEILEDYGILIHESAQAYRDEIVDFVKERCLSGKQLNSSFHKSWEKVKNASDCQLVLEQMQHYLSTYGVRFLESAWGVDLQIPVYLPNEEQREIPETLTLKVIRGVDRHELIQKGLDILTSGVALKQETLLQLFSALIDELGYSVEALGKLSIPNAEARILLCDRLQKLPLNDDLFRYFYWKATGELLIIKNDEAIAAIKESPFVLPHLTQEQGVVLAASFNRYKPLWLAFKTNPENCKTVNWISRLSKTYHVPKKTPLLLQLTQKHCFTPDRVEDAAWEANPYQLIRTLNAVRCHQHSSPQLFRIRNGKSWVADAGKSPDIDLLKSYEATLAKVLCQKLKKNTEERFGGSRIYLDPWVNWALPTSEKKFVGDFPEGSQIDIDNTAGLVGVHWFADVDIDIKFFGMGGTIGWDYAYRSPNRKILFSGDMTAPVEGLGASEFLYFEGLPEPKLVTLNLYYGDMGTKFTVIVGEHKLDLEQLNDEVHDEGIIINPNEVKFTASGEFSNKRGLVLGLVEPIENGSRFTLSCSAINNARSTRNREITIKIREAIAIQAATQIRVRDIFDVVDRSEDADIDLSVEKLSKESLLLLVN